jgi:hypothetical protein
MKLYTERQMKEMFRMGLANSINEDGALEQFAPIEPPSHYEIWEEAIKEQPNQRRYDFMRGADWMRDKIQGGNNEQL